MSTRTFPVDMVVEHIVFRWSGRHDSSRLELHNRKLGEAMAIAQDMGFVRRCWYRPSTWNNSIQIQLYDRWVFCSDYRLCS